MRTPRKSILFLLSAGWLLQPLSASAWTSYVDCEGGILGANVLQGGLNLFASAFSLTTYSREQAANGTQSCKMGITQGSDGWGQFGGTFDFPTKVTTGSQIWVRVSLYVPAGFNLTTNTGVLKFMRIHTASAAGANEGYHDILIANPGATFWNASTNFTSSYIYNFEGLPSLTAVGVRPTDDLTMGRWETYEMYVKFDSVSKDAGGQGEVRIWKNNTLLLDRKNSATLLEPSSYSDHFYLFTYWNGNGPATQFLYADDITMTTDTPVNRDAQGNPFIGGPQPNSRFPKPPTAVSVQ